jgi:hypothetical protein
MKCTACGNDNKDSAKACKKCGRSLSEAPAWFPDAAWHLRTLLTIYAILVVVYFVVSFLLRTLPKPYHVRDIPPEMTPWLRKGGKEHLPEEKLQAPAHLPRPANPSKR